MDRNPRLKSRAHRPQFDNLSIWALRSPTKFRIFSKKRNLRTHWRVLISALKNEAGGIRGGRTRFPSADFSPRGGLTSDFLSLSATRGKVNSHRQSMNTLLAPFSPLRDDVNRYPLANYPPSLVTKLAFQRKIPLSIDSRIAKPPYPTRNLPRREFVARKLAAIIPYEGPH